jgi:hypothetical protein
MEQGTLPAEYFYCGAEWHWRIESDNTLLRRTGGVKYLHCTTFLGSRKRIRHGSAFLYKYQ